MTFTLPRPFRFFPSLIILYCLFSVFVDTVSVSVSQIPCLLSLFPNLKRRRSVTPFRLSVYLQLRSPLVRPRLHPYQAPTSVVASLTLPHIRMYYRYLMYACLWTVILMLLFDGSRNFVSHFRVSLLGHQDWLAEALYINDAFWCIHIDRLIRTFGIVYKFPFLVGRRKASRIPFAQLISVTYGISWICILFNQAYLSDKSHCKHVSCLESINELSIISKQGTGKNVTPFQAWMRCFVVFRGLARSADPTSVYQAEHREDHVSRAAGDSSE